MLTPDQRQWCLNQAIEIIKLAPADALPTHDRLKRVYKRLQSLCEDAAHAQANATTVKEPKEVKSAVKKA